MADEQYEPIVIVGIDPADTNGSSIVVTRHPAEGVPGPDIIFADGSHGDFKTAEDRGDQWTPPDLYNNPPPMRVYALGAAAVVASMPTVVIGDEEPPKPHHYRAQMAKPTEEQAQLLAANEANRIGAAEAKRRRKAEKLAKGMKNG